MFDQLSLPGLCGGDAPPFVPEVLPGGSPPADQYLLFFAFLPGADIALQAERHGQLLRTAHQLKQRPMPAERLHVTVQPVMQLPRAVPRLIVRAAIDAAQGVVMHCHAVTITFDRAGSMGVKAPSALALKCDEASAQALLQLRAPLVRALKRHGFPVTPHHDPHMTLVYGTELVANQAIAPLCWTATRLVLVLSHCGRGHHEHVKEWPLYGQ
jgi:2'-5' RNA ligase